MRETKPQGRTSRRNWHSMPAPRHALAVIQRMSEAWRKLQRDMGQPA